MNLVEIKGRELHFLRMVINHQQYDNPYHLEALIIPEDRTQWSKEFIDDIKKKGLLKYEEGKVYATELAIRSINDKDKRESKLIEEYIIDDFEYAFLMFMNDRNEPVPVLDFPPNFKYHSKIDGQMVNGDPNLLLDWMSEIDKYITYPNIDGFILNETGKKRFEKLKNEKELNIERKNLEMQKLRTEVENLTNVIFDYPTTKWRAKYSFYLSILAVIIAGLVLLLRWLQKSG